MSFRSTLTSLDYTIVWPEWFREEYEELIYFPENGGPLQSKTEAKVSEHFNNLDYHVQKAIEWGSYRDGFSFVFLFLHECGAVTRCSVTKDTITWSEPVEWEKTGELRHNNYCSGGRCV